jgi:hypothetical protein
VRVGDPELVHRGYGSEERLLAPWKGAFRARSSQAVFVAEKAS